MIREKLMPVSVWRTYSVWKRPWKWDDNLLAIPPLARLFAQKSNNSNPALCTDYWHHLVL